MSVEIRTAKATDKARCQELLELLGAATGSSTGSIDSARGFDLLVTGERGSILVAEESGTLLGMATFSYNLAMRYNGEYCQLEELIVTPEARGKNVGGLLVQGMLDAARERGAAECGLYLLETTEHNAPFYAKYGFERIGTEMRQRL